MKSISRFSLCTFCVIAMLFLFAGYASAELKFAINPRASAKELTIMFSPLAEYLSKAVGEKVTIIVPKDMDTFVNIVKSGQVDLGYANPLLYVNLNESTKLELLAIASEPKTGTKFRGIIIARKDSGIEKINDLRGKKLICVDKNSP